MRIFGTDRYDDVSAVEVHGLAPQGIRWDGKSIEQVKTDRERLMVKKIFGRWNLVLVAACSVVEFGMAQEKPVESAAPIETATQVKTVWKLPEGVTYERSERQEPRPLQIHSLVIDMQRANVSFEVVPGEDPDGAGPAEVALNRPEEGRSDRSDQHGGLGDAIGPRDRQTWQVQSRWCGRHQRLGLPGPTDDQSTPRGLLVRLDGRFESDFDGDDFLGKGVAIQGD